MGWFDSQIEERLKNDQALMSQTAWDLSVAITGRGNRPAALNDTGQATVDAVTRVLGYYHAKPAAAPRNAEGLRELLDAQLRGTGFMYRRVTLSGPWYKDAIGAMLGILEDGTPVALLPQPHGGYAYADPATGESVRLSAATAKSLRRQAFCFYRPLPQHELGVRDILLYIARTLDAADYALVIGATLAVTLLGMLLPSVNNLVFGPLVNSGNAGLVAPIAALLVAVSLSQIIIEAAKALVIGRAGVKIGVTVQAAAMMRTLSLPAPFYRTYASGDLSARLQSIQALSTLLQDVVLTTGLSSVFSLAYVVQIVSFAPGLVLPSLAVVAITLAVSLVSVILQVRTTRTMLECQAKRSGWEYALISGMQKIRLAGAEHRAFATWGQTYKHEVQLTYNGPRLMRYANVIITAVSLLGTIAIYWFAVQTGVTVAEFMAFNTAYGMMSGGLLALTGVAASIASIGPHLDMAAPILKTTPEETGTKPALERISGRIELDRVTFRYSDTMPPVLDGLSLKVRPGEYLGIVGKTGCGKSTLIRLLLGFETPQKGAVYYDGRDLSTVDAASVRRSIGTVLQDGKLLVGDILSNIVVAAPWLTEDDAWKAAEIAGIADDIRAMPMGMRTMIAEGAGGISGGQKQRILIARAVAPRPKVLIFDEATSALDNVTQRHVSEALDGLKCTRIAIAHRLSTIKHCDRIIVLDGGHVAEEGTFEELMALGGIFAELADRQRA